MPTAGRQRGRATARLPQGQQSKPPWSKPSLAFAGALIVLIVVLVIYILIRDDPRDETAQQAPTEVQIDGLRVIEGLGGGDHRSGAIEYPQNPPAGGPHNAVWQNCGVYSSPVPNETSVHSQEHGAVWITYSPRLDLGEVDRLRVLARSQPYVLLSPSSSNPAPIVLSSWGRQLEVQTATDYRINAFLRAFLMSPPAPEPGAPCSGGNGEPL